MLNSYVNGKNNNPILSASFFGKAENEYGESSNSIFGKGESLFNFNPNKSLNDSSKFTKNENFNKYDLQEIKNEGMKKFLRGLKGETFLEGSLPDRIEKIIKKKGRFALFLLYVVCLISKTY